MATDTAAQRLRLWIPLLCGWLALLPTAHASAAAVPYQALLLQVPGASGVLHVVASAPLDVGNPAITTAVIAIHGHSRDVMHTFQATTAAAAAASQTAHTLVVVPIFQVAETRATRCHSPGLPATQTGDLLWTCSSWQQGAAAQNTPAITANMAVDMLVAHVLQQFPAVQTVTIAGFSAGGQLVQRYIGFAALAPRPAHLRYVVGSPSSWLYFDPERPLPTRGGQTTDWATCTADPATACEFTLALPATGSDTCPGYHQWKYGTGHWPAAYGRSAAKARAAYVAADVTYLLGAQDTGSGKGAAYNVLDTTCPAQLQGPYRLQRGLAYAAYDNTKLAGGTHRLMAPVAGCGHDVRCVFTSDVGRAALFGTPK